MLKFSAVLVAASYTDLSKLAKDCIITLSVSNEGEIKKMFGENKNAAAVVAEDLGDIESADEEVLKNFTKTPKAKDLIEKIISLKNKSSANFICVELGNKTYGSRIIPENIPVKVPSSVSDIIKKGPQLLRKKKSSRA